jgi:hypothetical protein
VTRHPITVRSATAIDGNAIIGYDPPMRSYFLQAFEDPKTEDLGLWLGTRLEEYPSLPTLLEAARTRGFSIDGLTPDLIADMHVEQAGLHQPSLVERCGWPLR